MAGGGIGQDGSGHGRRRAQLRHLPGRSHGAPRGALVIVQEIFGVNSHIRAVCDDYAAQGYVAVAPALFDRVERRHRARLSARRHHGRAGDPREGVARSGARRRRGRGQEVAGAGASASSAIAGAGRSPGSRRPARAPSPRRSATTAAACRTSPMSSRTARCCSTSASRTTPSRSRAWKSLKAAHPELPVHIYPPATASTATSALRTMPRARASRASARSPSCASTSADPAPPPGCDWTTRWPLP